MNKTALILRGVVFFIAGIGCDVQTDRKSWLPPENFVADKFEGEKVFNQHCLRCHGEKGGGTKQGPPLVHKIYESSHHADVSFYMAVKNGVKAHHWTFGSMPPIKTVSPEQTGHILAYIRNLQKRAGIF